MEFILFSPTVFLEKLLLLLDVQFDFRIALLGYGKQNTARWLWGFFPKQ